MLRNKKPLQLLQKELLRGAKIQDDYDLATINLIAPASPTPYKYFYNLPLRHNAIAEGLLGKRPYAGAEGFNMIEGVAVEAVCRIFNAEHANVQPHSVSQANQAVYQALLQNGDKVLAMRFDAGGHLTHGMKINFSGRFFSFSFYGVDAQTGLIDYNALERQAIKLRPKLIVCGASSYPRTINFNRLSKIAQRVGAYLLADISHPAGFIAAGKFPAVFPYCDAVTSTLDKTMLGPHGGIILCKKIIANQIDKAVHPGVQSSVPLRRIYQIAQCAIDAMKPEFRTYINRILRNTKIFEEAFRIHSNLIVTGGSDTHLLVINTLDTFGLTGKDAEKVLESVGILTNRQVVPGESLKPYVASGIRLGTSWITARGYSAREVRIIAHTVLDVLSRPRDTKVKEKSKMMMKKIIHTKHSNDVWANETI